METRLADLIGTSCPIMQGGMHHVGFAGLASPVIDAAPALDVDRVTRERAFAAAEFPIVGVGNVVAGEGVHLHDFAVREGDPLPPHHTGWLAKINHQAGGGDGYLACCKALAAWN